MPMRIIETRRLGSARVQIAEHCATGWTVVVFLVSGSPPLILQSDDPASLYNLIRLAQEHVALTMAL